MSWMWLRCLVSNRINVKMPIVRTTDCYVLRTVNRIGLSGLFLQHLRVAQSACTFFNTSKLSFLWGCYFCFLSVLLIRAAPNYFFSLQFQHFKTLFPIYVCMYVCMYLVWWSRLPIPCSPNRHTNLIYTASNFSVLLDFNAQYAIQYCNLAFAV